MSTTMVGGQLIRVNPRDTGAPPGTIVISAGALQTLQAINSILKRED